MIIGIDGGALSVTDDRLKVGVYKVIKRFLENISQADYNKYYRVYSFREIEEGRGGMIGKSIQNRVLFPKGFMKIWIPLEIALHPVNVFLGMSQILPNLSVLHNVVKYTRRKISTKMIGFVHDVGFLDHPEYYPDSCASLSAMTDDLVHRAHHIVAVSRTVAHDLARHYSRIAVPVSVIHEGVDPEFRPDGISYKAEHPYFLFVGALKRQKNIPGLIKAYAGYLKNTDSPCDLYLVGGDYWPDPEIDRTITALRLSGKVIKKGFVSERDLPSYYRGATAFVSPAMTEGFGLPIVEAQACGCPVIAVSAGAVPEIAGVGAVLVSPSDENGLAQALQNIATKPNLRTELTVKGLYNAKRYTWENFTKNVVDLCGQV